MEQIPKETQRCDVAGLLNLLADIYNLLDPYMNASIDVLRASIKDVIAAAAPKPAAPQPSSAAGHAQPARPAIAPPPPPPPGIHPQRLIFKFKALSTNTGPPWVEIPA